MAADLGAIARGPLGVDQAAFAQAGQGGEPQALLHDIEARRVARQHLGDGQAGAVDGDARAHGEFMGETARELEQEAAQAGAVGKLRDAGKALDDTGEHG